VAFVSSGDPTVPKSKEAIVAHLRLGDSDTKDATVGGDLTALVSSKHLAKVGKTAGRYCGWILPEHAAPGNTYLKEQEIRDAEAKKLEAAAGRWPKEHEVRREAIVAFVSSGNPTVPKSKEAIMTHLQKHHGFAVGANVTSDLNVLTRTMVLTRVGKSHGQYCGWIQPGFEMSGVTFFEDLSKKTAKRKRAGKHMARAPAGGGRGGGGGGPPGGGPTAPPPPPRRPTLDRTCKSVKLQF
jgi:hypothetical protein